MMDFRNGAGTFTAKGEIRERRDTRKVREKGSLPARDKRTMSGKQVTGTSGKTHESGGR